MRKWTIAAGAVCLLAVGACESFLNADKAVNDPNNPTGATRNQLFVGVLANTFANAEGPVAMIACQWMQQCAGINGRFVEQQGTYSINSGTFDIPFQQIYTAGGLVGLRAAEASADADGDKVYKGVLEVLEAMDISFAADVWGDIPYRFAISDSTRPPFDPQMQVYDDMLALLDKAIGDLGGAGAGPGAFDLIYGGDKAKWIQAAHTLKARIYLHRVEKLGNAQYASALTEARAGISAPANDFKSKHTTATSERNMWAQFQISSFGNDLVAGKPLVDAMVASTDSRLAEYFGKNAGGAYGGYDVTTGATAPAQVSPLAGSGRTNNPSFQQPIMTSDETQLIIAEAALQTGDRNTAATAFNAVRTRLGKATIAAAALTLANIMTEKYIALFQNPEYWNDYKRTCLPVLHPARSKTVIPGRLYYGQTEEQTNPRDADHPLGTPASSDQDIRTVRNPNDPAACAP